MSRVYPDLTRVRLHEVLHYDPSLSDPWTWKIRTGNQKVGSKAGSTARISYGPNGEIYQCRTIGIDGQQYRSARLAWFYMTGEWPPEGMEIDHKNGDSLDDSWTNLRLASSSQQKTNQRLRLDNKLGLKGVSYHKQSGLYRARIRINGQDTCTYHITKEEAAEARRERAEKGHGVFANIGANPLDNVVNLSDLFSEEKSETLFVWKLKKLGRCDCCRRATADVGSLESYPNPCMDGHFWGYLCHECHRTVTEIDVPEGVERVKAALRFLARRGRS